jgi:hypothetical protein
MLPGGTVVKPGDELALEHRIVQVKHVTPTGQIVLTNGKRYDRTGQQIGGSMHLFARRELSLATDKLRAEIARESCIDYLKALDWKEFDDATLARVVAMLKKAKRQNEEG